MALRGVVIELDDVDDVNDVVVVYNGAILCFVEKDSEKLSQNHAWTFNEARANDKTSTYLTLVFWLLSIEPGKTRQREQ